jgi:hypothetical protein
VDDLSHFRRYAMGWRYPLRPVCIIDPFRRDPRETLEELREVDPDAHALLTEWLVLPKRRTADA